MMKTGEQVIERFSKVLKIPQETLSEKTVISDIVSDSLIYFELFLELERGLHKKLSFEDVIEIKTLGDVISFAGKEQHASDKKT